MNTFLTILLATQLSTGVRLDPAGAAIDLEFGEHLRV